MIEIRSVSHWYGRARVLDDVSATIPAGGVTSLVGPNGAGKSTLLSLASRLEPLSAGSVTVAGLDVTRTPSRRLARTLGVLRQENHVSLRLSVRDLVGFGRFPHSAGRLGDEDRAHVERALEAVSLGALAGRRLDELSGGQRQRAFIAMVLAQDTEVLMLDEPLNSLDMRHSVEVMRLIRSLADDHGKTVVVVIHDVNLAARCSDSLLALKDGRAVCHGAPEEVMRPDVLREVFEVEADVHRIEGRPFAVPRW